MKKLLLFLGSIAVIGYAFYLRSEYGSAGAFAIIAVPAMFYVLLASSYYTQDYKKNRYNGYPKRK